MIAIVYHGKDDIRVDNVPIPKIGEDEALMKVQAAFICGTDIKIKTYGHFKNPKYKKRILGHELAGDIVDLGSKIKSLRKGMRVSIAPNIGCGHCNQCITGNTNLCEDYEAFGITMDGAFAEFMKIPYRYIAQGNIFKLPDSISYEEAALAEPLATVFNASEIIRIRPPDIVLIIGAGPMGILNLLMAKTRGAQFVIVSELIEERRKQAEKFGADVSINPKNKDFKKILSRLSYGRGPDVIIIAAPSPKAQEESVDLIARCGRICFFGGLPKGKESIKLESNILHYKQILVTGTTGSSLVQYRKSLELIISKKIDVSKLITAKYSLKDAKKAFKSAESEKNLKVLFRN